MGTLFRQNDPYGYGFGGFSRAPPSKQHLSTPPPRFLSQICTKVGRHYPFGHCLWSLSGSKKFSSNLQEVYIRVFVSPRISEILIGLFNSNFDGPKSISQLGASKSFSVNLLSSFVSVIINIMLTGQRNLFRQALQIVSEKRGKQSAQFQEKEWRLWRHVFFAN